MCRYANFDDVAKCQATALCIGMWTGSLIYFSICFGTIGTIFHKTFAIPSSPSSCLMIDKPKGWAKAFCRKKGYLCEKNQCIRHARRLIGLSILRHELADYGIIRTSLERYSSRQYCSAACGLSVSMRGTRNHVLSRQIFFASFRC